jgi:hypothetical protein
MNRPIAPYLSIVLTGRNDDFGGDFNQRLFAAASYNHRLLAAAGVDYEMVFVSGGPSSIASCSRISYVRVPEVASRLTAYEVDEQCHDAFSQNLRLQFHEFIAKNVGIRRAAGRYI